MRFRRLFAISSSLRPVRDLRSQERKNRRVRLLAQALEDRAVPATVLWDGGAGSFEFNDAANWSTDIVPGPGDDVVIPALPGNQAVLTRGILSLASIRSESPIVMDYGNSVNMFPTETTPAVLSLSAGQSSLSKGLFAKRWSGSISVYANGAGTSLVVDGPLNMLELPPANLDPWHLANQAPLKINAMGGAKIRLNAPDFVTWRNIEIVALEYGSSIEIYGQDRLTVENRLQFAAGGGGAISMPDLKSITLNANAESVKFVTYYSQDPGWYNGLTTRTEYDSGTLSFPKLTAIDDPQEGHFKKTTISGNPGSRIEMPELLSLRNASVGFYESDWIAPKLRSFTRSEFGWNYAGKTIRFDALSNIDDTSLFANQGFVEIVMQTPIDLANSSWDTTWKSSGPLSALTITTPQMRGQLGQGHFFRIEAVNGGLVTLNSATLIDDADSKSDGGIYLKGDSGGVLRMNVANTRGTTLDLYEKGIAAYDQVVDARFKMLRGWDRKSGKLYGSRMKSLTVDTYAQSWYETGGKYWMTNPYDARSLVTPALEVVNAGLRSVATDDWSPPAFPEYRTVTWDGGAGTNRWTDSANWSDDRLPGPNTSVIINAQPALSEILIDANANVRSIESHEPLRLKAVMANSPITLNLLSGASILHAGLTLKDATIATRFSGTTLDIYGSTKLEGAVSANPGVLYPVLAPSKIGFTASDGSWLFVHDTSKFDPGLIDLDIRSTGGGSRLIFPSLATIALETPRTDNSRSIVRLTAENRAEIDLPQLRTMTADLIYVTIQDSWISSPRLTGISRASIRIVDSTNDGIRHSDWIADELTYLTASILRTEGEDIVESFSKVKSIDETEIRVTRSKVYFPAVEKIDLAKFFYQGSALQELDESKRGFLYATGYYVSGSSGLLEIRASELSGNIPDYYRFEIDSYGDYEHKNGSLISLMIPVMKLPQAKTEVSGRMRLSVFDGGVIRADATTAEGMTIALYPGGAIAFDKVNHGKFRQIYRPYTDTGGTFFAANMELMTISELDWRVNTNLNIIVAPKLRMINGNFESVANPFPLLESITGSILLKHEPGTPVSQITVFDTPKIGRITNLGITMEQGVRWPQLEAQADWSGLSVLRLNSDGSKTPIGRSDLKIVQATASASALSVSPIAASTSTAPKAAAKQAAVKPAKAKVAPKPVPKSPVVKPKVTKNTAQKPAPKLQPSKKR
ncbi:hypothetical protein GC170_08735 [bacterium]|nr:hypothetical protein [bacterium]